MNANLYRIQRKKKGGQYHVVLQSPNSRKLNSTETFTQKHSAMTNIRSVIKGSPGCKFVYLQDDTIDPIVVRKLMRSGKLVDTKLKPKK